MRSRTRGRDQAALLMEIPQNPSDRETNILIVFFRGGAVRKRNCSPRRIATYRAIGLSRDAHYSICVVVLQGKAFFVYAKNRLGSLPEIQFQRMESC